MNAVAVHTSMTDSTALLAKWLRRPPRGRKILGSNPACTGIFPGWSHTSDLKIGTPVATLQAPDVKGSVLGLVGLVSVYCDWVRWKFDLQLLSQCGSTYNCLSRSVPVIHSHVAGMLSNQKTNYYRLRL